MIKRIGSPTSPLLAAVVAACLVTAGIFLGSGNLVNFDVALVGYAVATVFLAVGVAYRVTIWAQSPAARRYLSGGMRALLLPGKSSIPKLSGPRTIVSTLLLQRFIARRSTGRWLAHQGLFWGVVLATAMTFPLTFGWIHFRAVEGTDSGYWIHLLGVRTIRLDALSLLGWMVFHGLDVAALLVIAGSVYFLRKRLADRRINKVNFAKDLLPLIALLAISITGLALTVSSVFLAGAYYRPLAFIHMVCVVLTLVWIPFGKFFHTVQRPAMIGAHLHKQARLEQLGTFACQSCGEPIEGAGFVSDLQATMGELGLEYPGWVETCPRCKRIGRGAHYRSRVKAGF
ncbi:MAG: MFS transporter [Actinomycetota bacterium]